MVFIRYRLATVANTSAKMDIGQLHDFEFAIILDSWLRLEGCRLKPPADGDVRSRDIGICVQQHRRPGNVPAFSRLDRVVSKQQINSSYGLLGVACVYFC